MSAHPRDLDVLPSDVRDRHQRGEVELVDIREPYEVQAGRIPGARHVEMADLASGVPSLPRDRPVVFYCRVGARSSLAAGAFRRAGFDAYSMAGGLARWAAEGLPLDPPDGHVAAH